MLIIDLLTVLLFVFFYYIFIKKNQANSLFAAFSLLLANLISSPIAKAILEALKNDGWIRANLTIALIYIVLIILIWGILFTLLANISLQSLDQYRRIVSLISSAVISVSIIALVCFAGRLIYNFNSSSSYSCNACSKIFNFYIPEDKKVSSSYIPKNLQEVYSLPDDLVLRGADNTNSNLLLNKINSERTSSGLLALTVDPGLEIFARSYAEEMLESLRFSHVDKNNSGPEDRAKKAGLNYVYLGENLALATDADAAHQAFMSSASHKDNILSSKYKKIGITSLLLSNGSILVVEEFSN